MSGVRVGSSRRCSRACTDHGQTGMSFHVHAHFTDRRECPCACTLYRQASRLSPNVPAHLTNKQANLSLSVMHMPQIGRHEPRCACTLYEQTDMSLPALVTDRHELQCCILRRLVCCSCLGVLATCCFHQDESKVKEIFPQACSLMLTSY